MDTNDSFIQIFDMIWEAAIGFLGALLAWVMDSVFGTMHIWIGPLVIFLVVFEYLRKRKSKDEPEA